MISPKEAHLTPWFNLLSPTIKEPGSLEKWPIPVPGQAKNTQCTQNVLLYQKEGRIQSLESMRRTDAEANLNGLPLAKLGTIGASKLIMAVTWV